MPAEPAIRLSPDPRAWHDALSRHAGSPDDRAAMGLPTDRPVIMSGHQPVVWHAGILAKLIASSEIAQSDHARSAWIIADMDEVDPTTVRVPHGSGPTASARSVRVLEGDPPGPGIPTAALAPREPAPGDAALPGLADGLTAHADEATLALQVGHAVVDLACERFAIERPVVFACSDLVRTHAWRIMLEAMRVDPAGCVRAYNTAADAHPEARVRTLETHGGRIELPLWRVRPNLPRLAVFAEDLGSIPPDQLRPRALTMTAIVRAALCDLFVHGTGGGLYDRVTEDWFAGWSGAPDWTLAPTAVATADAYADLGIDAADLPDAAHARWKAHHARHDPAMLGDEPAAKTKKDLLARIEAMKARAEDPAPAFRDLHDLLDAIRTRHADRLAKIDADAARAERLAGVRALATDRTWPWPALPDATLDALHAGIRGRLASVTIT